MNRDPYHLERHRVAAAFNRAASGYQRHAAFQDLICGRLDERLDLIRLQPSTVVDLGAGCGNGVRRLQQRYRRANLVAVDLAVEMLRVARRQGPRWFNRQHFVCADAAALPFADASADLVFSNLALQWCPSLDAVLQECRRILKPEGLLLFSTLGPDTLKELRQAWTAVERTRPEGALATYTHVNAFIDMHDIGDALIRAGFAGPVMDVERVVLTYPDVRALMRELKGLGAHNVTAGRRQSLTRRQDLNAMIAAYDTHRRDGLIPATHEVVYGHAWAPSVGARPQDGSTVITVPLDQIRRRPGGHAS